MAAFAVGNVVAQTSSPPHKVFDGPPVVAASENIAYVVTLTDPNTKPPAALPNGAKAYDSDAMRVVRWEVVKSGKTSFVELTAKNGQKGEIWKMGNVTVVRLIGNGNYFVLRPTMPMGPEYQLNFGKYGFLHTDWISERNFRSKTVYQGRPVLAFGGAIVENSESLEGTKTQNQIATAAYVDFETRYPILVQEDSVGYKFQYLPAPTSLPISPAVAKAIETEGKRLARMMSRPNAP